MNYYMFEQEGILYIIWFLISLLAPIFSIFFYGIPMLIEIIKGKYDEVKESLTLISFSIALSLPYYGPFLIIYPLISWLFIPDYALSANLVTHLAANSFIFIFFFLIYLVYLKYLDFKLKGASLNSSQHHLKGNRKFLFISKILLLFWVSWSIFFFINDGTRSKEMILSRKNNENNEKQILNNATLKFNQIKDICNDINKIPNSYNYRSDSISLIVINNHFEIELLNSDLKFYYYSIDDPRLSITDAEKLLQIKCVARIRESVEYSGKKYVVPDPIIHSNYGVKSVIYKWNVNIVDIASSKITASAILRGPNPPETILLSKGERIEYFGIKPEAELKSWFQSLKYKEVK